MTAALCLVFVKPGFETCRRHFGHDFLPFYVAGTLAREGRHRELYDLDVIRAREQMVAREADLALGDSIGPWWNPPLYAWLFEPLSRVPFGAALVIWTAANVAALAAACWMLGTFARQQDRPLVAVLLVVSSPLLQSLSHGQNSPISLLLVALVAAAWRSGRAFTAGAVTGLLLYKPQLAAVLLTVLVVHRGRQALLGTLVVAGTSLALTALTMPDALAHYINRLPLNLRLVQEQSAYLWERHVTLKAFWRLLLQGRGPGETGLPVLALTVLASAPLAAALAVGAWRTRITGGTVPSTDRLIAATVATTPLLMPFYFDYDLLLMAVPAVLVSREPRRALTWLWATLYVWLFVNPFVAPVIRFNLTIPLLTALAAMLIWCTFSNAGDESIEIQPMPHPSAPVALPEAA